MSAIEQLEHNLKHSDHKKLLMYMCKYGYLGAVQNLVSKMNSDDFLDTRPLIIACENSHIEVVKYLVKECGMKIKYDDYETHVQWNY